MSIDREYLFEGLLRYNFFPMVKKRRDDIPPLFSTESLGSEVADKLIAQQESVVTRKSQRAKNGYDQIEYRTTRFGNIVRLMHIPHPAPFARLCGCLRDNWDKLDSVCDNSHSQCRPQQHDDGRVLTFGEYELQSAGRVVVIENERFPDEVEMQVRLAFGARYFVKADVSSCFPSLYTHAIPWALVGHDVAKSQRGPDLWFNRLDWCQRHIKRNETHGVPIGPATSNIVNEILLSKVDDALAQKGYRFLRYIDDYKCYCDSRDSAEQFLRDLEASLNQFQFLINPKKVAVLELPLPLRQAWITELTSRLPSAREVTPRQIIDYLDMAMNLQHASTDGSAIKFAARSLQHKLSPETAELYVKYLIQVAMHFPSVLPMICGAVRRYNIEVDAGTINELIVRQLLYRRSDAICWCIYLIGIAKKEMGHCTANSIIASRDCMSMAAMLAVDAFSNEIADYVNTLSGAPLFELDRMWLLIHELAKRERISDPAILIYVEESGLKLLASEGVSFLRKARRGLRAATRRRS